MPNEESVQMP